ncbi:MAG TPA: hypothetical protein VI757_10625 [Bacteroidia bacterium]|nr:hypothetical protein [Bacteroidia bacterium]
MRRLSYILFAIVLVACNTDGDKVKELTYNVAIFFHDNSLSKENSSLQLFIDNKQIFQTDSVTKSKRQDFKMKMDTGKHVIYVQTLDKQFGKSDTIEIAKVNQRYILSISFNYNPPTEWFKDDVVKQIYSLSLRRSKLKPDTTIQWLLDSLTRQVERESKTSDFSYKPSDRYFEIKFYEQPKLM